MVTVEESGAVRVVRIENGPVNVLDLETVRDLAATMKGLADARAVVITGAGRAFSAGVDLKRLLDGGPPYTADFVHALVASFRAVFDHPRPVVAAINGHAIAGGCVIAAACDRRVMSAGTIGVTELLVGVPFPAAALEAIRYVVGPATADMVLTGRTLTPAQALELRLVDEVVPPEELLDTAVARAEALARIPAESFAITKEALRADASRRIAESDERGLERTIGLWQSEEIVAAIRSYVEGLARR